ncbi:sigma-70 family RNA polymerase sigma factor [Microbacterium capsulatum]|uniref:Sigma-70 family RNA polymerase sigma factor n=1 Tax=Microbacterium capsulatum TaxID=3041921 RepID=A0ABU0XG72_9MICO|nr:sigma-70 family RNA polymerase sigma factor [Microbacterium sp. ASV81]MDQ4213892.1 sigma-70 family RNA polymerase sigma factor [Microbacterium sp. ASV81]
MTATDDRAQPHERRDRMLDAAPAQGWAASADPVVTRAATEPDPPRWERAAALFLRWRDGEPRAMDELVRLMTPVLWHVARAYGLDRALAEDVVQSTWMTLMRRHASIAEPLAISGWLTTCARREAWRVGRLQRRADPTETESLESHLPAGESAERQAQRGTEAWLLWQAVGELNVRCQRLLRIVAFEERPDYARIAQDLAMPIGSIGPTRQRCLGKLRALLEKDGWEVDDDDR